VAHRIHETLSTPRNSGLDSLMTGPADLDTAAERGDNFILR
jgi:hypothetical protein